MNLIYQPPNSKLCGQTCVAMIAGISLEESIKIFGKTSGTTTKEVSTVLNKLGINASDKLIRISNKNTKPNFCIVKLHYTDSKVTHWTIYNNGLYYDPYFGLVEKYDDYVRETSYLEINI